MGEQQDNFYEKGIWRGYRNAIPHFSKHNQAVTNDNCATLDLHSNLEILNLKNKVCPFLFFLSMTRLISSHIPDLLMRQIISNVAHLANNAAKQFISSARVAPSAGEVLDLSKSKNPPSCMISSNNFISFHNKGIYCIIKNSCNPQMKDIAS